MKDDLVYVEHVLDCIERIETYIGGKKSVFMESTLVQDAVIRNLQVMAESTQRLSEEIRGRHPELDWRGLAGFRNVLAHGYLGVDAQKVWELVETRLGALRTGIESIHTELVARSGPAGA